LDFAQRIPIGLAVSKQVDTTTADGQGRQQTFQVVVIVVVVVVAIMVIGNVVCQMRHCRHGSTVDKK
jgi:hypothetical protein